MNLVLSRNHADFDLYKGILAVTCSVCFCSTSVFAKTESKVQQGLIEETPRFDLSLQKLTFQLNAKHNELIKARRPILRGQDALGLLKGGVQGFRLQAQIAKNGRMLNGRVDKNGNPLTGRVSEDGTPLNTFERVNSPFHFDLRKLTAAVAPDIVSQMDSEIEQAHSRTADNLAREEKEMEPELRKESPRPEMPEPKPQISLDLSRKLEDEMAALKKQEEEAGRQAAKQLAMASAQGDKIGAGLADMAGGMMPHMPQSPAMPGQPTNHSEVNESEREMSAELERAKIHTPKPEDIAAKLNDAMGHARTHVSPDQPGLDAILTHTRAVPGTSFPALPKATASGDAYDVVPWDEWHARFAQLARGPILANVSKVKNPSGNDTVTVTVWRDHRLDVKLTKSSNAAFDRAILDAYKQLAGNADLEFPKHSVRKSITFLVDNQHKGAGIPTGVQSQTSLGDHEVIQYHL
jgi:hypothetical protein